MPFHFDVYYPDKERPEFMVSTIEEGYQFTIYDEKGNEQSFFPLRRDIVHNEHAAIGKVGKEAEAVVTFREFLKERWRTS